MFQLKKSMLLAVLFSLFRVFASLTKAERNKRVFWGKMTPQSEGLWIQDRPPADGLESFNPKGRSVILTVSPKRDDFPFTLLIFNPSVQDAQYPLAFDKV